jgi:hypothetical protein
MRHREQVQPEGGAPADRQTRIALTGTMRAKEPHFRPKPTEPCPCGSGKVLAHCCLCFDGTIYKERISIRPPGPVTGYSHPGCYLSFTENCDKKLTGEHVLSRGIFAQIGQHINVTGAPWLKPDEMRTVGIGRLTSKILCKRHNSAFSGLDATASRFFQILTDVNINLATASLSRQKQCYLLNGEDLEMWAAKVLLGLLHSEPKNSALGGYTVDNEIVKTLIRTTRLPPACGLYLRAELGDQITYNHKELMVSTITSPNEKRLLGLTFHIESVPFDFWMDNTRVNFAKEIRNKLYRPSSITFEGRGRSHTIFLSWPPDPTRRGMVFTLNQGIRNRNVSPKRFAVLRY